MPNAKADATSHRLYSLLRCATLSVMAAPVDKLVRRDVEGRWCLLTILSSDSRLWRSSSTTEKLKVAALVHLQDVLVVGAQKGMLGAFVVR